MTSQPITLQALPTLLANDIKVKLAGVDPDGVLRGKVMSKEKFLSIAETGFGFSSAVFGWDMQDMLYTTTSGSGYSDFTAIPDLGSFRRIPWEEDIPLFLVRFVQNDAGLPVGADGRGMMRGLSEKLEEKGCRALAGGEYRPILFHSWVGMIDGCS